MRHREKSNSDFSLCLIHFFPNSADFFPNGVDFLKNLADFLQKVDAVFCGKPTFAGHQYR